MSEPSAALSDYERLSEEFRKVSDAVDASLQFIQDGIELEDFRNTKAGKILIARCMEASRKALGVILDPNVSGPELEHAVQELRVQHRVLDTISTTIQVGRMVERRIQLEESAGLPQESEDEQPL